MSEKNLIEFLRMLGNRPEIMAALKHKSKAEVIVAASELRLPFTSDEFNAVIWDLEQRLAEAHGEKFDFSFPLWRMMWGQHYLEFLAADLLPALETAGLLELELS